MAGKKQQAPKPVEEDEEAEEGWDNVADVDAEAHDEASGRMRDWRDVEKYREMRELRRLVGDEFDFTDVLGEIPIRTAQNPGPRKPAKPVPPPPAKGKPVAPPPKAAAHKTPAAAKKAPAPAHKPAASAHKPPAKPAKVEHQPVKKAPKPAPKKAKAKKK